jgi:hypothetical protein
MQRRSTIVLATAILAKTGLVAAPAALVLRSRHTEKGTS